MAAKDVLIIELNEFNYDLIAATLKKHSLPTLAKIFNFPHTNYKTQDRYNSGYLEPWVQWVNVHTGVPSLVHRIKHLGDVPDLGVQQCWETLSEYGVTTGVWGVMNGERRDAKHNQFFLPDPWTFSEWATPNELNSLLRLPRYISKNYQNLKKSYLIKEGIQLFSFILRSKTAFKIFKEIALLGSPLKKFGFKHFLFISCFDAISTLLFIQYKKRFKPQCSYLFLNSLAHIQHHHWREGTDTATPEILFGLKKLDAIFKNLLKEFPNDAIVMHNALSQMNTNHEKPWVLYRQKDPERFLQEMAIQAIKVEQHMTHDGHAFFSKEKDCEEAYLALSQATLNEQSLFHVERNANDPCKLFYMLRFTDELCISDNVKFILNGQTYPFFKYFDKIVTRTGRHIPMGKVFSSDIKFPNHIQNYEFNQYVYRYLAPERFQNQTQEHTYPVSHATDELECL